MDSEDLTRRARTGQGWLSRRLAALVVELGHADELPRQVARGDWHCAKAWAAVLSERGEHESALEVLRPFAATGWWEAAKTVAELLERWDRTDEAIALVQPFAAAGLRAAIGRLARLLVRAGRHDEAFGLLRPHATGDEVFMARMLAARLTGCGRDEEITAILEGVVERSGDVFAVGDLATLYEHQGRVDEAAELLRTHMHPGGGIQTNHIEHLADLLARHGRFDDLDGLVAGPGGEYAAVRLAGWHAAEGEPGAAIDVLMPFVDRNSTRAAGLLATILATIDRIDAAAEVLRPLALEEGGQPYSAVPMYLDLLAENGRHDEALAFIDGIAGPDDTPEDLVWYRAEILRGAGRADEALSWLRGRPDADERWIQSIIAEHLSKLGRDEELIELFTPEEGRAKLGVVARTLVRQGRVTEAMDLVHAWTEPPSAEPESLWGASPPGAVRGVSA